MTTICKAIKKTGKQCSFKTRPNTCYCGVHKNYIDISKPLFSDEVEIIEPNNKPQVIINFMDGSIIITDKYDYNNIINTIKKERNKPDEIYSLFSPGEEDEVKIINHDLNYDILFCVFSVVVKYKRTTLTYMYPVDDDMNNNKYTTNLTAIPDDAKWMTKFVVDYITRCYVRFTRQSYIRVVDDAEWVINDGNKKYYDAGWVLEDGVYTKKYKIHTTNYGVENIDNMNCIPSADMFE